ncbi:MAG TPA: response regulator [Chitinophagaceae bacterium]|nr:response regulator [Chitinophagaceae bacterium]
MDTKKTTILYAEDDLDDLHLVQECFAEFEDTIELLHVTNGQEAINLLDTLEQNGTLPCLIILDINMPVMDGKQALVKIKSSLKYKDISTVMFTTSNSKMDISFARVWGADFITKPLRYEDIADLAQEFSKRCNDEIGKRA